MKVTLKDIAKVTGVSLNTVSRALKDKPDIGQQTKVRVREAAERMGYTPNLMARGLVLEQSYTIGLVATEIENPVRSMVVEYLRQQLLDRGYQLLVIGYKQKSELDNGLRELLSRGVDGIILGNIYGILAEQPCWKVLEGAVGRGLPVVAFSQVITTKVDCVQIDYGALLKSIIIHLNKEHGYQKIAFVGQNHDSLRFQVYSSTMTELGLSDNIQLLHVPGSTMENGRDCMTSFLENNSLPQALVCRNDLLAVGVMAALHEARYRIPQDVAVTGLDNIEISRFMNPPLATAGIDSQLFVEALMTLLFERVEGRYSSEGRTIEIPGELFWRKSCGCN